jgi:hypothetical protein
MPLTMHVPGGCSISLARHWNVWPFSQEMTVTERYLIANSLAYRLN